MARYKGGLKRAVQGAATLSRLRDGDRVLISEGCTHHRQCGGHRHGQAAELDPAVHRV